MTTQAATTSLEDRALKLLGSGIDANIVARNLGVHESRIAQMVSEESFASRLAEIRYENLRKHNARDEEYDDTEDRLLKQFKSTMALIQDPMKLLHAIKIVNSLTRRGASAPDSVTNKQTVVQLVVPVAVMNRFSVNSDKQVITVNDHPTLTVQSGQMTKLLEARKNELSPTVYVPLAPDARTDKFGFASEDAS